LRKRERETLSIERERVTILSERSILSSLIEKEEREREREGETLIERGILSSLI